MKKTSILSGVMVSLLLAGAGVCHAEKWDKNNFQGKGILAGYYGAHSVKVKGPLVSWTEKYVFAPDGAKFTTTSLSNYPACKDNIAKKGEAVQFQVDYQVKKGKYRGVSKRYYNKSSELLCADKDLGKEFDTSWSDVARFSPIEEALYDLVTKYKISIP